MFHIQTVTFTVPARLHDDLPFVDIRHHGVTQARHNGHVREGGRDVLTGPKPKEITVETFRINYLIRSPKVEELGFEPVSVLYL